MIAHYEPFPGTAQVGLEVAPSGPYAVLVPPWSTAPVDGDPLSFSGLLGPPGPTVGIRLTAGVYRMSGLWPSALLTGGVHLRGFDRDGKMLWRANFAEIVPVQMTMGKDWREATFDLMYPGDLVTL